VHGIFLPGSASTSFYLSGEGVHPHPSGTPASPGAHGGLTGGFSMSRVDPARILACFTCRPV
jgi:hypothetical protein